MQKRRVEGLTDEIGRVTVALETEGKVFVHGELWDATSVDGPIPKDARVQIVGVENLHLTVRRADDRAS